jgi:hypothetical protein
MPHTITISKRQFTVEPRYAEGHTLKANEAAALNQTLFENLRNNFKTKADEGATQEDFDAYAKSYEFGVRTGGGGGSRDPIEVEAMNLAREAVRKQIVAKGGKVSDYTAASISEVAAKLVEARPEFREKARERVEQMQAAAQTGIDDDIFAGLQSKPADDENETGTESGDTETSEEAAAASTSRRNRRSAEASA